VARNLAAAAGRRRRKTAVEPEGAAASVPDPRPGQLHRVVAREDRLRVRRLLGELRSVRDREVLWRFHLAEESRETICRDLGLTASQLNVVLFRARQRFKKLVEEAGLGPGG
jgi:RNA polymerase sigma-70 factor (ECF subfamily)